MPQVPDTVLLTGFAPFGGESVNASWQAVSQLDGEHVAGHRIVARELPVMFGRSLSVLRNAIRDTEPALVLCVGQAGGRALLALERVAINLDDADSEDDLGARPVDVPVVADGPAAYFATLPIKSMLAALQAARIPAEVSLSAGTYVCNHVFYGLMHELRDLPEVRGGFIHVPYVFTDDTLRPDAACLALDVVVEGLRIAVRTALASRADGR